MCTVTFIPKGNGDFFLTSNRDENPLRSAHEIISVKQEDKLLVFPKDVGGNGSWLAISDSNQLVCLLNGAFIKHKHQPPYRHSRGLVVIDFFKYPNAISFFDNYDFSGLEPFTLVIFDQRDLWEFRWDEETSHVKKLDENGFHIWSSCTLYPDPIQQKRRGWFRNWLEQKPEFSIKSIRDFHLKTGDGDLRNDLQMNRDNIVRTVSVTNVERTNGSFDIHFRDLLEDKQQYLNLEILPAIDKALNP